MEQGFEAFNFKHFRFSNGGGATVAICEIPHLLHDFSQYGFKPGYPIAAIAFCNPNDQFSRKYGRQLAIKKLTQYHLYEMYRETKLVDRTFVTLSTVKEMAIEALTIICPPQWLTSKLLSEVF